MEYTHELLTGLRKVQELLDDARSRFDRLADIPMRTTGPCVYRELMQAGHDHEHAWALAGRIISEGDELQRLLGSTRAQSEVIIDVVDDSIGASDRLF